MDEAAAQQFPSKLEACDGQRPVEESGSWWGPCTSGLEDLPSQPEV